ncbi:MAG: cisplatin damage response ATP-dependent DNA ligase [Pseudomonadota bacterium]
MRAFADLLENLLFAPGRNAKLALMVDYFRRVPDPDRGWALAALTGELSLPSVTSSRIRGLVAERVDPELFRLSYDYVGDLAETAALIWPEGEARVSPPVSDVVARLSGTGPVEAGRVLTELCDAMGSSERLALIKLATGGLRVGVSARLARTALAQMGAGHEGRTLERIEELWFGLEPPFDDLFHWLEGGSAPQVDLAMAFRPVMLANPLDEERLTGMEPSDYVAEWKWDGIRIQATAFDGERRLYTRTGDEISQSFPDVIDSMTWQGTVDGELLVVRDGEVAPFADLQKRLGRKRVGKKTLADAPAHLRLYDLLHDGETDRRAEPLEDRRARLIEWHEAHTPARTDVSTDVAFASWEELADIRATARETGQEGLMLKRRDAPYSGGRPMGPWFKWKRDPLSADCVMVYAQRGHGKRSSFYSDYTFAAWTEDGDGLRLVPVGKAYSGFTDQELAELDKWVRNNTVERYGPVRAVKPEIVLEIAFDAIQRSSRHKSGVAMRFPRIKRIRWDKPAAEADHLTTLVGLIAG